MPLLAERVIALLYVPAFCELEEIVTVNVAVEPLAIVTGLLTASQPLPLDSTEGVIVTLSAQVPVTLRVKLAVGAAGSEPALALKLSAPGEAASSVQGVAGGVGG